MTTYNKFKEYIWLVNTIYRAKSITFAEINEKWMQTEMSEGIPLSRTTFYRHKCAIEDIFGIYIECDKKNNTYYIGNENVLDEDSVQNWMLSTLTVSNVVSESQSLHHRILLENVPSGGEMLQQIIKAMKENYQLCITYHRYSFPASKEYTIDPYCTKFFHRRWYLLGRLSNGYLSTFSLDRMENIQQLDTKFTIPDDFDAAAYFQDSYGMLTDDNMAVERIVLRAYEFEPYYMRDLPLHHSQREIATTEEYTDFELHLKPTSDFKAQLMSRGQWIEILEPKQLAEEIVEWHQNAINRYKK